MLICDKVRMTNMHGIRPFAFLLLAAVAFALGADLLAAEPIPTEVIRIATPNHDPDHMSSMRRAEAAAANPAILRAEPVVAAPSAPAFVAADNVIYARANARLRAAPSTAADVMAKLAANAPLQATARSKDGAWWQVSLAEGRTGYVHRDAVTKFTKFQVANSNPPAATAPVAAASAPPVSWRRSQDPLVLVKQAMNWLADVAGRSHGSAPKIVRAER
jgi:hypothetical protein